MKEETALEKPRESAAPMADPDGWEWDTALGKVRLSLNIVRRYFCAKATEPEVVHFIAVCRYHKLNPYLKEAYLIKYSDADPAQIVIGRDTHARRAEEHPQYNGDEGGIIVQTADGKIEEREGEFFLEPEKLVGGWAKIYRKDRERPIVHRVRLQDWVKVGPYWKSSPAHMIAKVARAQGRHEAFPKEFEGIISEDEAQAGPKSQVIDIQMPLSVAEAAAEAAGNGQDESPAAPEPRQEQAEGLKPPSAPAGDAPSPEEQAKIKARELEEAQQPPEAPKAPPKLDRGTVWNAVLRKAKAERKTAGTVLKELTAKGSMQELEDVEVTALAKKLGVTA